MRLALILQRHLTMQDNPYAFHAVVLAYGASRDELAQALEEKAKEVRAGHPDRVTNGAEGALLVREGSAGTGSGEEAFAQRMYMVFYSEGDGDAFAMFSDKELADRLAAGKPLYDEGDGPGADLGVARVDLAGTWWNSYDPDPTETVR